MATELLVIGNLVEDRAPGGWIPGGPALYAARMSHALGARVSLVTMLPGGYPADTLAGLNVRSSAAATAARYANTYDAAGNREQLLLHPGEPLSGLELPHGQFDAVLLAPAFHEIDALAEAGDLRQRFDDAIVGVALQGVLRDVEGERVVVRRDGCARALALAGPGTFAFFSDEDIARPAVLAAALARQGATAFLTRGYRGARRYDAGGVAGFPACPASPVDPTGAGDSFAAAFMVRYAETRDLDEATWFAMAASAVATEHSGPLDQPARADIETRLAGCRP